MFAVYDARTIRIRLCRLFFLCRPMYRAFHDYTPTPSLPTTPNLSRYPHFQSEFCLHAESSHVSIFSMQLNNLIE